MNFSTYVMLILATVTPVSTAGAVAFRSVETSTPEIETTTPLQDLLENERFSTLYTVGYYEKASSTDHDNVEGIYPIYFTEWMYGYDQYGLYFYVWNQTQTTVFNLTSELNGVTIQDVSTGDYELYPVSFVSKTGNQFYKYKLDVYDLDLFKYLTDTGTRQYSLGQFHFKKINSSTGLASAYPFGKRYIYSGTVASEDLAMEEDDIDVLSVSPTGGVFRTDSAQPDEVTGDAETGYTYTAMAHNDLHYVYFNIPNEYLAEYGNVAEYHFSYYPVFLNPIMGLSGSAVSNTTLSTVTDPNTSFGSNYYAIYQWLKANELYKFTGTYYKYGFTAEKLKNDAWWGLFGLTFGSAVGTLATGIGSAAALGVSISLDQSYGSALDSAMSSTSNFNQIPLSEPIASMSSKQMDAYVDFSNLVNWAYIPNGYTADTFSEYLESLKVEEHLRYDQENYLLEAYDYSGNSKAMNTFRDNNNGYPIGEDVSVPAISKVNLGTLNTETLQEAYFLEDTSDTLADFEDNCSTAIANNETPYIFRFAHTYSYLFSLFYNKINKNTSYIDASTRAGTLELAAGIYDFVSLDLTFAKDGVETIMPICADPININPGLPAAIDPTPSGFDLRIISAILAVLAMLIGLYFFIKILPSLIRSFKKIGRAIKSK